MKRWISHLLMLIFAASVSVGVFQFVQFPFFWVLLLWTVVSAVLAVSLRGTSWQTALINGAAVLLALTAFEGYLTLRETGADPTRMQGDYTVDYFDADEVLGYGPARSRAATSEKYFGDELIYSVRYTIDGNGMRVSPAVKEPELGCVLFFGGSVTFGEGVADEQAMPYQVGEQTDNRYRVHNFAFHGYGPHQMLAALESGRVDQAVDCQPTHIIYQAIIPHIERAAGRAAWDKQGPRYTLDQDGGVALAGRFDDEEFSPLWKGWPGRWLTYDTLFGRRSTPSATEVSLYTGIVNQARTYTEKRYPGSEFHVLIWDNDELAAHDRLMEALAANQFRLHRISDILPEYLFDKAQYELSVHDHHPAAGTHREIARYVVERILAYDDSSKPAIVSQ